VTDAPVARSGWSGLPRWARIGIIALGVVILVLVAIVPIRLLTRVAPITYGATDVDDLRPGSCLTESDQRLETYTVTSCAIAHPLQVFADVDLDLDEDVYAETGSALQAFADATCDRFLEYRLFLVPELEKNDYAASAIDVPTPEEFAAGDTVALCVLAADDGGDITGDAYRALP